MENRLMTLTEVACEVGCSVQTLNTYYKFKMENPDSDIAMMLPDYIRKGNRRTRYWSPEDVEAIKAFREMLPKGRYGLLGSVTQRYVSPKKEGRKAAARPADPQVREIGGLYIDKVTTILQRNHVEEYVIEQVEELLKSELEWRMPAKAV
ncbi:MAG: hypothetical protein IKS07_07205 [Lachnospiraceae bacterium]|nr:hypothetical protein [Lachnospiraceae bacterium]